MSQAKVEVLTQSLKYAVNTTVKAAEKVSEDVRLKQVAEGKAHPLWLVGHMGQALDTIVVQWLLGAESQVPELSGPKFAPDVLGGEAITGDAANYPAWDDVVAQYKKAGAAAVDLVSQLQDADLDGDPRNVPEQAKSFFGNLGESLVGMIGHDAHHRGQMILITALPE